MALFPIRHRQKDFFVLDISDVVPKDDTASMEHPFFSLATKPDMRHLHYENGGNTLEIMPSAKGLPTIFDKDILIFCISQLVHKKNTGADIGKRVRFTAHELLVATNRPTNDLGYKRLEDALSRLRGTTIKTNILHEDKKETKIFGIIDSGGFVERRDIRGKSRLSHIEITLSDFTMEAIENSEILTIHHDYFRIRRPLERRLYEIARKHCGDQQKWEIGIEKLQVKTGSNAPLKRFRHNLREIIKEDQTPSYRMEIVAGDRVVFRPRNAVVKIGGEIEIPAEAEEEARAIALEKGWDYYALEREWLALARAKPPRHPAKAFIGFCKKKPNLR